MAKFIKKFETHADYEAYMGGGEVFLPNVSKCADDCPNEVHYNPYVEQPIIVSTTYMVNSDDGLTQIIGRFGYEAPPVSAIKNIWIDGELSPIVEEVSLSEGEHHIDYEFFDNEIIPAGMFCYLQQLRSVVIPEGVVEIGVGALAYSPLETLSIPESVKILGEYAVYDLSEEVFELVDGVIYVDKIALGFYPDETYDPEQPVVIREGTKFIMSDFAYSEFSSISIPDSVISVGEGALNNCLDYTIEDGIVYVGDVAIGIDYDSFDTDTVIFKEGTRIICDGLFKYDDMIKSVVIPDSVITIGNSAFMSCYNLESVTLGQGVKYIGISAFEDTLVENIEISDNVEHIGSNSFMCYAKSIVVSINNKYYDSRNECNALIHTRTNRLIRGCDNTVIPNGVKIIGSGAFYGLEEITTITIPNSVMNIGHEAFHSCNSLTSVTIPNSVTSIGEGAFQDCTSLPVIDDIRYADCYVVEAINKTLETYKFKEGTRFIGGGAFQDCEALTSITIPNSVTSIGGNAFYGCSSLASITIPNGVKSIGENVFGDCYNITSVNIPNSVTSIGNYAFSDCNSLTSITIPNSVMSIGQSSFERCWNLLSIEIPNSVVSIKSHAFYHCTSARSIIIGSNVKYIEDSDVFGDVYVTEFINNSTLDEIENNYWGASVYDIINSDGICIKDNEVKNYLNNDTEVVIPNGVTSIGKQAFYRSGWVSELKKVTIPDSVTIIKEGAFNYCNRLEEVIIGTGITSIQRDAFYTFNTYVSYYIYATTPPSVEGDIFYTWNSYVKNIYVPTESVEAYKSASFWSKYASIIQPITD